MKMFFIFLLFWNQSIFAYTPTLDGLFRNGNNIDINQNTVVSNLVFSELNGNNLEKPNDYFVKFVITNDENGSSEITQLNFSDSFNNSSMRSINTFSSDGSLNIFSNNENFDGEITYAILEFLILNKSKRLIRILKKNDSNIKSTSELINEPKLKLLESYKRFLEAKKENPEDESLINPLKPKEDEELEKVKELNKQKIILADDQVKRIKLGNEFFYIVDNENIYIRFDKDHRIKEFNLRNSDGTEFEAVFGRFVLFSGGLEFPEFIDLKLSSGKEYRIKAKKYSYFEDDYSAHKNRVKRYKKIINKNNLSEPLFWPAILL